MATVLILLTAALLAYALNQLFIRFSRRMGALTEGNKKGELRWASRSKPLVGGMVFFLVFVLSATVLYGLQDRLVVGPDAGFLALLLAGTVAFGVGLNDDVYNTTPGLKFLGQLGCGVLLIAFGQGISFSGLPVLDYGLTLFWVVGLMNSFNMLDNMDGVSGSFSVGVLITLLVSLVLGGLGGSFFFYLLVALAGAHIGFLVLNWRPSKLYMGDTGSQFLGLLLAYVGIEFVWNLPSAGVHSLQRQFLLPVLVFLPTLLDTTFVTVARLVRGQSPFVGGKDHISHHLVYAGVPERHVPLIFGGMTLVSGAIALVCTYRVPDWHVFHSFVVMGYIAGLTLGLAWIYRIGMRAQRRKYPVPVAPKSMGPHPLVLPREQVMG